MPRLADIAKHADVSEATVSRVLNGRPGVAEATRQAVLTSLDVLGYDRPSRLRRSQRRAGRADPAGADQPDLPGLRAGHRDRAGAARVHAGALHAYAGRGARGRLRADASRPGRRRHHLHLRPARRHDDRPQPLRPPARPRPAHRPGQRLHAGRRRALRLQRRRRRPGAGAQPPDPPGAHARSGWRSAPAATCRRSARSPATGATCPSCSDVQDVDDLIETRDVQRRGWAGGRGRG